MNAHLSDDMILELAEAGTPHPHFAECGRCRGAFEEARDALGLARAERVPDPSPLFWEHFSARVHQAVEREAAGGPRRARAAWFATPLWRPIAALALVAVIVAAAWQWQRARSTARDAPLANTTQVETPTAGTGADAAAVDLLVPATDPSWTVIAEVTAHVPIANAADAGLVLQADATDHALTQLSPAEQQALVRLLQAEPDGPSQ